MERNPISQILLGRLTYRASGDPPRLVLRVALFRLQLHSHTLETARSSTLYYLLKQKIWIAPAHQTLYFGSWHGRFVCVLVAVLNAGLTSVITVRAEIKRLRNECTGIIFGFPDDCNIAEEAS